MVCQVATPEPVRALGAEGASSRPQEESSEMDEQRVPNLQEMDDQQAQHFLTKLLSNHRPKEEYNVRHPEDYVMEMPQSGERFRGRENMRSFQQAHPTPPSSLQVRRVLVKEGVWVVEGGHRLRRRAGIGLRGHQRAV